MKIKHYDNDPEEGGKEISAWDDLKRSGELELLKNTGFVLNPTHNFELLKQVRQERFEKKKQALIKERDLNKMETTDHEIRQCYLIFLNDELKVIDWWLNDNSKYSNGEPKGKCSINEKIEINKYKAFVNAEIDKKKPVLKGFNCIIEPQRIEKWLIQLIKDNRINKDANPDYFKDIFINEILPDGFERVKWILLNKRKQPHKTALREFLTLALGKSPDQKIIDMCFTDAKGKSIQLAKPKKSEFSNYYGTFEKMIKE